MKQLFLDTNQWNYLVSCRCHSAQELAIAREALAQLGKSEAVGVVGSLPVLQEIVGTVRQDAGKYGKLRDLVFGIVGAQWLLPLDLRYAEAVKAGGLLSPTARV